MTLITSDTADVHQLYLDTLDDPQATDLAGAILGMIQLRKDTPTDDNHVHALTDSDLVVLAVVGGPVMAVGIGLALLSEHVHVTID
jgi:enoyl-CoA hydratase/carnithine racemase